MLNNSDFTGANEKRSNLCTHKVSKLDKFKYDLICKMLTHIKNTNTLNSIPNKYT